MAKRKKAAHQDGIERAVPDMVQAEIDWPDAQDRRADDDLVRGLNR